MSGGEDKRELAQTDRGEIFKLEVMSFLTMINEIII